MPRTRVSRNRFGGRQPPPVTVIGALLVTSACSGAGGAASGWDGVERDSAGITVVENFGTPLWGEEPLWTFHEVLRIGTADGDPDYQFGRITGVAILSDGSVAVGDGLAHNVRYFSPDGVLVRTVGKAGGGPGEFSGRSVYVVRMLGDTLLAMGANRKVNVFAPDGILLHDFSLGPRDGYRMADWDTDGSRWVTVWEPLLRPDAATADLPTLIIELDVRGNAVDTVAIIPSIRSAEVVGEAVLTYYYRGEVEFDLCGSGIWLGASDEFTLGWYRSADAPERVMTLHRDRVSLGGSDEAVMMAWYDELLEDRQVPQARAAEIRSRVRFEDTYPAFRRFICGPASTLMVQQFHPLREVVPTKANNPLRVGANTARRPPPSDAWDVFDADGHYLGVAMPPWDQVWRAGMFAQRPDGAWYVYGVTQDEEDVEYVVVWRVEGRMPQ